MAMEDDWDLTAVVRGGSRSAADAGSFEFTSSAAVHLTSQDASFAPSSRKDTIFMTEPVEDSEAAGNSMDELHEICKPFLIRKYRNSPPPDQLSPQTSASFSLSLSSSPPSLPSLEDRLNDVLKQGRLFAASNAKNTNGSKKRRNQHKTICHVPADALTIDVWGWRKYGQKPIKGSPFPRGYYRCSNSKSCMARKQVERSRTEPTMFVITYTGEHNHLAPINKSSLSGTTRQIKKHSPDFPVVCSSPEVSAGEEHPAMIEEFHMDDQDIALDEDGIDSTIVASDAGKYGHVYRDGLECPASPATDQTVSRSCSMPRTINLLL